MELFTQIINETNDILWTYILVVMLLGCAIWFSIKTKFVQFRMIGEMIRLLGDSTARSTYLLFRLLQYHWQAASAQVTLPEWLRP